MKKETDIRVSRRVQELIDSNGLTRVIVSGFLKINRSSFNDIMTNVSPWRLDYLSKIALYFGVTTDELIFGEKDYVKKHTAETSLKYRKDIKDFLVKEKLFSAYGKLSADGFFDQIK